MFKNPRSKLLFLFFSLVSFYSNTFSQTPKNPIKKYPSILWEITGKGMQKPSYLFGTMHVSNKMVFNLGDSFYHAIEQTDMIGLELDPGYWQEFLSKKDDDGMKSMLSMFRSMGNVNNNESLYKSMFSIDPEEKKIEYALGMEPTMVNSLLYRKSNYDQDKEEDTYLDLYLYQICNKLNKNIVGLEVIDTSERLRKEADLALMEDEGKNNNREREYSSPLKLQDAYKNGDLDLIDSLDEQETPNKKYRSIFLYHRNVIQAHGIDSVIKLHKTIFAGVGCAHLPGDNGVIEVLRKMGYKLRPVKMNVRNSLEKDRIDKIRFPVKFAAQYTPDSIVKADIPGKWYRFEQRGNVLQYADLANGSYYMLGRVPTDALFQGQTTANVLFKVDSLLYENIPGKIISKTAIEKNGYKGFDITNRTRRGDVQRYQIFITPFEVIIAKMNGSTDYVLNGTEANIFFNSIAINPIELTPALRFTPSWGAFSVDLPHQPFIQNRIVDKHAVPSIYEATDSQKDIHYCIMKETMQRPSYLEEDTFELNLLNESYMSSKFFEKQLSKKFIKQNGYPAIEVSYQLKDGNYSIARFVIQGPHYYAVIAEQKKPFINTPDVLTSFAIAPFKYDSSIIQKDTSFGFTFMSPVNMPEKINASDMKMYTAALVKQNGEIEDILKSVVVMALHHDSTGETINLTGFKLPPYSYFKDSSKLDQAIKQSASTKDDTAFITRKSIHENINGWDIHENWYTDSNSSRMLHNKAYYKQGIIFALRQYTDTLSAVSSFTQSVFNTFMPADSLKGMDPLLPKGALFFSGYKSTDSTKHARALSNLASLQFRKEDVPNIKNALTTLTWEDPNYLGIKKRFLQSLGRIDDISATDLLNKLYAQSNDTAFYQQEILNSLLAQKKLASFKIFEELFTNNPPVEVNTSLGKEEDGIKDAQFMKMITSGYNRRRGNEDRESIGWNNLTDTMQLTKQILPGIMSLMNLDDYKDKVEDLALQMADSGYVSADELRPYYTKFLLEGKHLYKKAVAQESVDGIKKKAEDLNKNKKEDGNDDHDKADKDDQFNDLYDHLVLLTPFFDTEQSVRDLVKQSFSLQDKNFKYKLVRLMIRKKESAYPDTLLPYLAKDEELRYRIYRFLLDNEKLDKFPAAFSKPLELAKSKMATANDNKPDTFAYVGLRPFVLEKKKGEMYFFKYKIKKADKWKWAMIGMYPGKQKGTWDMYNETFNDFTKRKVADEKTMAEQMDTILKETLNAKRKSAISFYENYENQYADD